MAPTPVSASRQNGGRYVVIVPGPHGSGRPRLGAVAAGFAAGCARVFAVPNVRFFLWKVEVRVEEVRIFARPFPGRPATFALVHEAIVSIGYVVALEEVPGIAIIFPILVGDRELSWNLSRQCLACVVRAHHVKIHAAVALQEDAVLGQIRADPVVGVRVPRILPVAWLIAVCFWRWRRRR